MEKENIILLLETIERSMSTKPIMEMEVSVPGLNNAYYVRAYDPNKEPASKEYIKKNKQSIKDFFDAGYEAAGLGSWFGCTNAKAVMKNTALLKVACEKMTGAIIAMSIYSGVGGGYKCVGITALVTENPELKELAKQALVHIIKSDISHFKDYYWIECSGVIKYWWEKHGGVKIPNSYLPSIFATRPNVLNTVKIELGEEYDYLRRIDEDLWEKKCIFGFPNKAILDEYIEKENTTIDEIIRLIQERNNIDESVQVDTGKIQTDVDILNYFNSLQNDEYERTYEITEYGFEVMTKSISNLEDYVRKYAHMLPDQERYSLVNCVEAAYWVANRISILKPYQFGDEFICEREIYPEDFSYDEHERRYL